MKSVRRLFLQFMSYLLLIGIVPSTLAFESSTPDVDILADRLNEIEGTDKHPSVQFDSIAFPTSSAVIKKVGDNNVLVISALLGKSYPRIRNYLQEWVGRGSKKEITLIQGSTPLAHVHLASPTTILYNFSDAKYVSITIEVDVLNTFLTER